jgi:hypothetical protein
MYWFNGLKLGLMTGLKLSRCFAGGNSAGDDPEGTSDAANAY